MIKAHMNQESAVPWWAAFGAPLIGVPLMILLLALGAPGDGVGTNADVEAGIVKESVEMEAAASATVELPPEYVVDDMNSRC